MEDKMFKGRKGKKRLQELNERIDQQLSMTDGHAAGSAEMDLILRSIPDPVTRLQFLERYKALDAYWNGMLDQGFLCLCTRWIKRKKITELDSEKIDEMFTELLPNAELQKARGVRVTTFETKR